MTALVAPSALATAEPFQRAINLGYDLLHPDRIAHFRPTSKSIRVIRAIHGLLPGRAFMTIAAYGTGKSIAAAFAAHGVMNAPASHQLLTTVGERLQAVDPELSDLLDGRVQTTTRGMVIALEGYHGDLNGSFREAVVAAASRAGIALVVPATAPAEILGAVIESAERQGIDRIAVIWDEFGRHLEGLIHQGRASELSALQQLAEWAGRKRRVTVTLTLLLHQGFFQYAGSLPQTIRNEWKKIEGRFETLQYVDDSREMYALLADVVEGARPLRREPPDLTAVAVRAETLGLFRMFPRADELALVLCRADPLDPATLYMLPRLAARVAQNERTLFSFLHEADLSKPVTLADLYDTFAPAMRADTTLGGTYRHWLETESALGKTESAVEAHLLKAACLLSLGLSGQRLRVGRDTLAFAVAGVHDDGTVNAAIEALIARTLLLYRRHGDDVSIWHGTDVDLRGRLEEDKLRRGQEFDLVAFLRREHPAPVWLPAEHNVRARIRRYYTGHYVEAAELLQAGIDHPVFQLSPGEDGRVIYPLTDDPGTLDALHRFATTAMPGNPGLVLVVPADALSVRDTALELWCLTHLQQDRDLTGTDPLVLPELQQMADDVRRYLANLMDRLLIPADPGPRWFCYRGARTLGNRGALRRWLSDLAWQRFPLTPVINNESVVRHKISRPMVNARKKVILGLLERTDEPHLGLTGTTPDASIYRTVLLHTDLVQANEEGRIRFTQPPGLAPGLREVWKHFQAFLSEPSSEPKRPAALFTTLQAPPYGLRTGVLPILLAAGFRAFPAALSIHRQGHYLTDLLPSDIEDLCRQPEHYTVTVHPLDETRRDYLRGLQGLFVGEEQVVTGQRDLIRELFDAIERWKARLPAAALTTTQVSRDAQSFQRLIRRIDDPATLFLDRLPALAGKDVPLATVLTQVRGWRDELVGVIGGYEQAAAATIRQVLSVAGDAGEGDSRVVAAHWGGCFSSTALAALDAVVQALVRTAARAQTDPNEPAFLNRLASILISKPLVRWDDQSPEQFRRALREAAITAEEMVLAVGERDAGTVRLAEGRLESLYRQLVDLAGNEDARAFLQRLTTDKR